jgi:hypothetical protein
MVTYFYKQVNQVVKDMKKFYEAPDFEARKLVSFDSISANTMSGDDNEIDAGEAWPDF